MKRVQLNQIPNEILNNTKLNSAIDVLPKNYTFDTQNYMENTNKQLQTRFHLTINFKV